MLIRIARTTYQVRPEIKETRIPGFKNLKSQIRICMPNEAYFKNSPIFVHGILEQSYQNHSE